MPDYELAHLMGAEHWQTMVKEWRRSVRFWARLLHKRVPVPYQDRLGYLVNSAVNYERAQRMLRILRQRG
jgi:hypothetical protein